MHTFTMDDFTQTLNDCLHEHQFNQIEITPLSTPLTIDFYKKWLLKNQHGSMNYLEDHLTLKANPDGIHPGLRSVISIAQAYYPAPNPVESKNPARLALYAQNKDYHFWLKEKLQLVIEKLRRLHPNEIFLPYVDSGPVLERNWAYEAGLGWFGKNTCLIHPQKGSLFFIAEILTSRPSTKKSAELAPRPDLCGTCTRCLDICPTQALVAPKEMRAELCISYLTIEAKGPPAPALRNAIGDWFFGCDLCQSVCPWNEKFFRAEKIARDQNTSTQMQLDLDDQQQTELMDYFRWLLKASHNQIQKKTFGTPLARAGAKGLKRNALIVIANRKMTPLKADVEKFSLHEFQELKAWTLNELENVRTDDR